MINLTKTSNPVLNDRVFNKDYTSADDVMTVNGTINKTALMLLIVVAAAVFTWKKFFDAIATNPEAGFSAVLPWLILGGIVGFITVLVIVFRPKTAI